MKEIVLSESRNVTKFARESTDEFAEYISRKSNSAAKKELSETNKKLKKCEKGSLKLERLSESCTMIMYLERSMTSSSEYCHRVIPRSKISLRLKHQI